MWVQYRRDQDAKNKEAAAELERVNSTHARAANMAAGGGGVGSGAPGAAVAVKKKKHVKGAGVGWQAQQATTNNRAAFAEDDND